mgnify:CR=1 FL=1
MVGGLGMRGRGARLLFEVGRNRIQDCRREVFEERTGETVESIWRVFVLVNALESELGW